MSDSPQDQSSQPITIYANEVVRESLNSMFEREEMSDLCTFENQKKDAVIISFDGQDTQFSLPVRIGTLLDHVCRLSKKVQRRSSAQLDLKHGVLDVNLGKFTLVGQKAKNTVILLTEKEVEILQYLYDNSSRRIPREELLGSVWGYAKNTETHTLETHIYRLRRKIEPDTASPVILKKDEDGYYLGE